MKPPTDRRTKAFWEYYHSGKDKTFCLKVDLIYLEKRKDELITALIENK